MKEKCVEIPYAGKFMLLDENTFRFMPTLELLTSGPFKLVENEHNIPPLSKYSARFSSSHKLSLSHLSKLCTIDPKTCVSILKSAFSRFVRQSRSN